MRAWGHRLARSCFVGLSERPSEGGAHYRYGRLSIAPAEGGQTTASPRVSDRVASLGSRDWSSSQAQAKRLGAEALAMLGEQACHWLEDQRKQALTDTLPPG